jgi:hypothetical protein
VQQRASGLLLDQFSSDDEAHFIVWQGAGLERDQRLALYRTHHLDAVRTDDQLFRYAVEEVSAGGVFERHV